VCSVAAGAVADGTCTPTNGWKTGCLAPSYCVQDNYCSNGSCGSGWHGQCNAGDNQCIWPGWCDSSYGCTDSYTPNGYPCKTNPLCASGYICENGQVTPPPALLPLGKSCLNSSVCQSGRCSAGVCVPSCSGWPCDTWAPTSSVSQSRQDHAASLLPNGKVMIVGGYAPPEI